MFSWENDDWAEGTVEFDQGKKSQSLTVRLEFN